ncbi:MAG: DNA repair protein RecO [Tissierellales bacterium]
MILKTEGLVLRQTKYDEWDKILTIFTKSNGKIQAIAKGARRPKGGLVASAQVFGYSEFLLYKGRNLYQVNQADMIESFFSLRDDLYKLAYATYIAELIDAGASEEYANEKLFDLSIKTLSVLANMNKDYKKLLLAFELKYISFIGYRPHLRNCVICNDELGNGVEFSVEHGGAVCEKCSSHRYQLVSKEIIKNIEKLLYITLDNIADLSISSKDIEIIEKLVLAYVMNYIEKRNFKSLEFLRSLDG